MAKNSTLRAIVLVSVFAGALFLSAEAAAESPSHLGGFGARSLARPGSGNIPGVCDPISPAPIAPTPRVAATVEGNQPPGGPAASAPQDAAPSEKPEPKNAAKNTSPSSTEKSPASDSTAKTPAEEAKPKLTSSEIAALSPEDKLKALFKANGCTGCHDPARVDASGTPVGSNKSEIAKLLLDESYVAPDEKMDTAVKTIRNQLKQADKDLLKTWSEKQ